MLRRWPQFSLRTLFGIFVISSVALWWWFRPIKVEEAWRAHSYGLTASYTVRRGINGQYYFVGPAALVYADGSRSALSEVDRWRQTEYEPDFENSAVTKYWHEDGRELTRHEWWAYLATDYIPRQINSQAIITELEWREIARKSVIQGQALPNFPDLTRTEIDH
jgi:hypothetical protein